MKPTMFVRLIQSMGDDEMVCNAARISLNKTVQEYPEKKNDKLIRYLAEHNHWSPFGHCYATFHIKAPIFVARQLVKHQVGLVWNEISRRYVDEEPEFYYPTEWRERPESSIKQGSGDSFIDDDLLSFGFRLCEEMKDYYNELLNNNVAPEQARIFLPINTFTEWYWTGSLMAWSRVCNLRCAPDAQKETREIAMEISKYCFDLFPKSWEALTS